MALAVRGNHHKGPWGIMGGVPPFKSTPWESSPHGVGNGLNHYFGCQIRNQRGRFTPGGFLLEKFFENFDLFELFEIVDSFLV